MLFGISYSAYLLDSSIFDKTTYAQIGFFEMDKWDRHAENDKKYDSLCRRSCPRIQPIPLTLRNIILFTDGLYGPPGG